MILHSYHRNNFKALCAVNMKVNSLLLEYEKPLQWPRQWHGESNLKSFFQIDANILVVTQDRQIGQIYAQNMLNLARSHVFIQTLCVTLAGFKSNFHPNTACNSYLELPSSAYFAHKFGLFFFSWVIETTLMNLNSFGQFDFESASLLVQILLAAIRNYD